MWQYNKMILGFFLFLLPFALSIPSPTTSTENDEGKSVSQPPFKKLTINLISWKNGVGLNQDIDILQTELSKLAIAFVLLMLESLKPL